MSLLLEPLFLNKKLKTSCRKGMTVGKLLLDLRCSSTPQCTASFPSLSASSVGFGFRYDLKKMKHKLKYYSIYYVSSKILLLYIKKKYSHIHSFTKIVCSCNIFLKKVISRLVLLDHKILPTVLATLQYHCEKKIAFNQKKENIP